MNLGKIHGLLDQRPEYIRLRQSLSVHLPDPGSGTIRRNDNQRNILIKSFRNSWVEIQQRRTGSTADCSRFATIQRKPDSKITRTPFISHRITGKARMIGQSMHNRRVTATGTQHNLSNAVRLKQRNQLEYVFLVCIHDD